MRSVFIDRYDAGRQLAKKIRRYKGTDAVVLALPRGGVIVGHEIATSLSLPLDIVITRRISHPCNSEVAICAITEDGKRVCNDYGLCGVDQALVDQQSLLALRDVIQVRRKFDVIPTRSITNKIVIVTDDGIATGLSMKAAILTVRSQKPKEIVIAVPVCPKEVSRELEHLVDKVVVLNDEEHYRGSVGEYYSSFPQVSDEEVIDRLKSAQRRFQNISIPQLMCVQHCH